MNLRLSTVLATFFAISFSTSNSYSHFPDQKTDPPKLQKNHDPTKDIAEQYKLYITKLNENKFKTWNSTEAELENFINDLYTKGKYKDFAKAISLIYGDSQTEKALQTRKSLEAILHNIPADYLLNTLDMEEILEEYKKVIEEILINKHGIEKDFGGRSKNVRYSIFINSLKGEIDISEGNLEKLLKEFQEELADVLSNQNLVPLEINAKNLKILLKSKNESIRYYSLSNAIARDIELSPSIIEELVSDTSHHIRSKVLQCPLVEGDIHKLLLDEKIVIQAKALWKALKMEIFIPPHIVNKLVASNDPFIKERIPKYAGIEDIDLLKLLGDESGIVRSSALKEILTRKMCIPPETMRKLFNDDYYYVRELMEKHFGVKTEEKPFMPRLYDDFKKGVSYKFKMLFSSDK